MERYTQRDSAGKAVIHGDSVYSDWGVPEGFRGDAVDRLAAYEDTGLEPRQVKALGAKMMQIYSGTAEDIILDMKLLADHMECEKYRALGTIEELSALVKAQDEGRVVVLPEVSERDRQGMADFLHDCFAEWIHDPSVGLYGMTEGEAALANAITSALTRAEAEAALGGGGDG